MSEQQNGVNRLFRGSLVLLCLLWWGALSGQSFTVIVLDGKNQPLTGALVQLKHVPDSVMKSTFTNGSGAAQFEGVADGMYVAYISHNSYLPMEKTLMVKGGVRRTELRLTDKLNELGAVTVTAARPLIRQEDDKMIIDPEPLANTSTNTLEVLESTPGLYVDQDGGIFLNSATPAVVYINGREQKMSSQDINTILRSLPPGSVQRIEVLRTPSTKYDAASSGGIINIVLKKGVKIGRFGSVNGGMNQGVYGNRFAGFTLNNSGDKSTMYLNGNYSFNDQLEEINALRLLHPDTTLAQVSETRNSNHQGYLGYGITYDVDSTLSLNYDGRLNLSDRISAGLNRNIIETGESIRLMVSDNHVDNNTRFLSVQQDFGMILKIDTAGSVWDTKFGYSYNRGVTDQDYRSEFAVPFPYNLAGGGENFQHRHFWLLQSDLTWKLPLNVNLETGIKSTWQEVSSEADFYTLQNDSMVDDPVRTNAFRHQERINAAYLQASRTFWSDFLLKVGARVEHTRMEGHQTTPADTSFLVNRADWFPYVYLSRKVFSMGEVELRGFLIFRKTISRPGYQSLNPTIRFIDQFLYETGNPALRPQFTDNYEFNISFNEFPVLAVGRNYTRDIFSSVVYQDEEQPAIAIRTFDNLGKSKETYVRGMVGIPPGKRYFFALGAQYNFNHYEGFYEGTPLNYERGSWRFFTFHSLTLFKETKLTMSGFMMHKGNYGFYELKTFGALNMGLSQTFMSKKLQITLNARDILRTMVTAFELNQGSIISSGDRYTDNQRFGINIRYNFGIKTKEEKKGMFGVEPEEM
jgi:iron complex outermembrane recepter protein